MRFSDESLKGNPKLGSLFNWGFRIELNADRLSTAKAMQSN